jgi:hypothetical protein
MSFGITVDLPEEVDAAFGITRLKTTTLGLAIEVDTAAPMASVSTIQLVTENDSTFGVTAQKAYSISQSQETDLAFSTTVGVQIPVGLALEADLSQVVSGWLKTIQVGLAQETDTARTVLGVGPENYIATEVTFSTRTVTITLQ